MSCSTHSDLLVQHKNLTLLGRHARYPLLEWHDWTCLMGLVQLVTGYLNMSVKNLLLRMSVKFSLVVGHI